jgi:diguanylate cyclase (GGDEF)-like protein/PAS domain S-box-containing protein
MANKRLQLEVLERELVEEQISRKSMVLDAINSILQHSLDGGQDKPLAETLLSKTVQLTRSKSGFIAEYLDGRWSVCAVMPGNDTDRSIAAAPEPDEKEILRVWRQLQKEAGALSVSRKDLSGPFWDPLAQGVSGAPSLLAVPLGKSQQIYGFIALYGSIDGYAPIDQKDVEALCQVFVEAVLRKRSEEAKALSDRRLQFALESTNEGMWNYAPASNHMYFSPRWFAMLGYSADDYAETVDTWKALTHKEDIALLENALDDLKTCRKSEFNIEIRMLARSDQWYWIQVRGKTVNRCADGTAERIVGSLIDVSKYKKVEMALQKANDELQRLAALDDLTQIANRRRFDDRLAQEWRRAQRDGTYLAVIICDIDHFKAYNDTYGHLKGDDVLHAVAQAIHGALKRPMDLVARYGGEEFAMILPGTDMDGAWRVAKEVKEAVTDLDIGHQSSTLASSVTLSFGVSAMIPTTSLSPKTLIKAADQAMYRAKAEGRDQIYCAPAEAMVG